jgi:hypothetical protein
MFTSSTTHGKKHGGTVMASDFFGDHHQAYGQGSLDVRSETVDFVHQTSRPELAMSGGATHAHHIVIQQKLKDNMIALKVSMSKQAFTMLSLLIHERIHGFIKATTNKHKMVSYEKLHKALKGNKFAIFA